MDGGQALPSEAKASLLAGSMGWTLGSGFTLPRASMLPVGLCAPGFTRMPPAPIKRRESAANGGSLRVGHVAKR